MLFILLIPLLASAEPLEFDGLIEPKMYVKLGSNVTGVLETVTVDRGDLVQEGQVLATLQSGVEKATMELAKAKAELETTIEARRVELEFAERTKQRRKELFEKKTLSSQDWDEVETKRILAEHGYKEAIEHKRLADLEYRRSLEVVKRMSIASPINGVVVERLLFPGEYVEDQPIMKLAQIDPLRVEVLLPVSKLGSVRVGMNAEVRPEMPSGVVYKAKVTIVDKVVDAASGTFGVRLELPNPNHKISPGLKCKVLFTGESR